MLLALAIFANCDKKPDLSKFEPACAKVIQCDKQFQETAKNPMFAATAAQSGGDLKAVCMGFLGHKKMATFAPMIVDCVNAAPCETVNFGTCFVTAAQGGVAK